MLEKGFGEGALSVVDEHVAPDLIEHQDGAQGRGPEAAKGIIRGLHASFTDMRLTIVKIIAVGDDV